MFFNNNFNGVLGYLYEGVMELPTTKFIEILEFLRPLWQNASMEEPSHLDRSKYPNREFTINLTDTKYESLKQIKVLIIPEYYDSRDIRNRHRAGGIEHVKSPDGSWIIHINLIPYGFGDVGKTLEHELIHAIQLEYKNKGIGFGYHRKKSDKYNFFGRDNNNNKLPHWKIPAEFQTNLISLIRKIEQSYTGGDKKEHFTSYINKLRFIKIVDTDIKQAYIKSSYNYFVNGKSVNDLKAVNYYYNKYAMDY